VNGATAVRSNRSSLLILSKKAAAEARNGFRQYDAAIGTIQVALERGAFKLRPSLILGLHREALAGISSYAGNYRPGGVAIEGSKHEPAAAHLVPELVEDMCDGQEQSCRGRRPYRTRLLIIANHISMLLMPRIWLAVRGRVDVSKMEELLGSLLANQLAEFYKSAGGKLPD
jgi:hypothetical protein